MSTSRSAKTLCETKVLGACLFLCAVLIAHAASAGVTVERLKDVYGDYAVVWNGKIFFVGAVPATGAEPWVSDGTESGTTLLKDTNPGSESGMDEQLHFAVTSVGVFFTAALTTYEGRTETLWFTDGTTAGTRKVRSNGIEEGFSAGCLEYGEIGGTVYFAACDTAHGAGLWRSDGTNAGTYLITGSAVPFYFMPMDGLLYFSNVPAVGAKPQLWKTDGTAQGTTKIRDDCGPTAHFWGTAGLIDSPYLVQDGILYFCGDDASHEVKLWRTDGTAGGTYMVEDSEASEQFARTFGFFEWNDLVVFRANSPPYGNRTTYRTDGTRAGTYPLIGTGSYSPVGILNNVLYLSGPGISYWHGFYRMDNPSATPTFLRDIEVSFGAVLYANKLYMNANTPDDASGELWVSDGTEEGTKCAVDINPGNEGSDPHDLLVLNDKLYFFCDWPTPALYVLTDIPCQFTTQPQGGWREAGDRLQLDVEVEETVGDARYQWTKDGHDIPDATSASYIIVSVTEEDSGTYRCRVTDDSKSIYLSSPAVITVFPAGSLPVATLPGTVLLSTSIVGAFLLKRRHTLRGKR